MSLQVLCPFLNWAIYFLAIKLVDILRYLHINPLWDTWFITIFTTLHCVYGFLCCLSIFILVHSNLYFLLLLPVLLESHPNTLSLDKRHKYFSLVLSSMSFILSGLRFKSSILFELLLR